MKTNKESYNKITDQWDLARNQLPLNRCVIDFASRLKKSGRVLDIGCGTGYPISKYLSDQGFIVTGIDISENMLSKAIGLALPNAAFYLCDFFDFEPQETYDGIVAFDSFFHFPKKGQTAIYGKLADWMNIGAYLLFTHGKQEGELEDYMYGERFYYSALDARDVHQLLWDHGFTIELSAENYKEPGVERDLLIIAKKTR